MYDSIDVIEHIHIDTIDSIMNVSETILTSGHSYIGPKT